MNKKYIAVLVIISLLSLNTLTPAQAFWPFGSSDLAGKDLRFSTVYPVSFWKLTTGKILMYTGLAVTIAAEWLGILGGVSVLSAVGSVALSAAIDTAVGQMPSGTHSKTITLIKPRLLRDNISPVVKSEMEELYTLLEEIAKGGTDSQTKKVVQLMTTIDSKLDRETKSKSDEYTAYNHLFMAIIRYNLNDFDGASEAVSTARKYTAEDKSSVLDYVDALLAFQAGDDNRAVNLLRGITEAEPKASTPYIVLGQSAFDDGRYHEAFDILDRGIKAGCYVVCAMNWMAGNSLYNAGMVSELRRQYYSD